MSHSAFFNGIAEGDPRRALWLLVQAERGLPPDAPARARAWLWALNARESALNGDAGNAARYLDLAAQAHAARPPAEPGGAFFADRGWFADLEDPWWLAAARGRTLARLGDGRAEGVLLAVAASSHDVRQRANVTMDVMELRLSRGEHDQAARLACDVLRLAAEAGLFGHVARLRRLRDTAPPAADPAFRDFDELLLAKVY